MDGNGRWAKAQGKKRTAGHEAGSETIRTIAKFCAGHAEIEYLTLYAFSTENWKRPKAEVDFLMKLLEKYLEQEKSTFLENGIAFKVIGDRSRFSKKLQDKIDELEAVTKEGANLVQILALNYGAQDEICRAATALQEKGESITPERLQMALDMPVNVDLLIRTGGDHRISNFLLWQASYAELFFTNTLWPDFSDMELAAIIDTFKQVERRFGGLNG